jgi:GDP-4-dehydro-6-deoxy-D-mannose reductase
MGGQIRTGKSRDYPTTELFYMRTLITGATGFVGGHLTECLLAAGDTVYGLARTATWPVELAHLADRAPLHSVDLLDADRVDAVLAKIRPDRIAHLAGFADVGNSFRDPDAAWAGNLVATRNLYDAIARRNQSARILFVSTGQVYGVQNVSRPASPESRPNTILDEATELRPVSPYAASKAAADLLSYQATCHPGLAVIRVRPFNHIGPRQPPQYAAGHFASQLARIEAGLEEPRLEVGDLSAQRDLTDVRDMVEAYRLLLDRGRPGEAYNAGTGASTRIADVLDILRAECRVPVEVVPRADRMRPADAGGIVADVGKLRRETGWAPKYSLRQTLADTLDSWRRAVAAVRSLVEAVTH